VVGSLAFLAATLYVPALQEPFGTVAPSLDELAVILPLAILPAVVAEAWKTIVRVRGGRVAPISSPL